MSRKSHLKKHRQKVLDDIVAAFTSLDIEPGEEPQVTLDNHLYTDGYTKQDNGLWMKRDDNSTSYFGNNMPVVPDREDKGHIHTGDMFATTLADPVTAYQFEKGYEYWLEVMGDANNKIGKIAHYGGSLLLGCIGAAAGAQINPLVGIFGAFVGFGVPFGSVLKFNDDINERLRPVYEFAHTFQHRMTYDHQAVRQALTKTIK